MQGRSRFFTVQRRLRSIITTERLQQDLGPRLLATARKIEHIARGML